MRQAGRPISNDPAGHASHYGVSRRAFTVLAIARKKVTVFKVQLVAYS